jgi:hypothetical protein
MPISTVGNHVGEIIATGLNKASTGNVQILVQFRDEEDNTITAYLSVSDDAWPYTEAKLIACGFTPADNDYDLTKLNAPDCAIIGMKDVPFQVESSSYNGKESNKVSWIGEGGGIRERLPDDEVKVFAATLRAKLIASKGGVPAAPAKKGAAPWSKK